LKFDLDFAGFYAIENVGQNGSYQTNAFYVGRNLQPLIRVVSLAKYQDVIFKVS
jgi:hypothetical protein